MAFTRKGWLARALAALGGGAVGSVKGRTMEDGR